MAPGRLRISGLVLAPARSAFDTFMGMPREAVMASLKNKDDKIAVDSSWKATSTTPGSP